MFDSSLYTKKEILKITGRDSCSEVAFVVAVITCVVVFCCFMTTNWNIRNATMEEIERFQFNGDRIVRLLFNVADKESVAEIQKVRRRRLEEMSAANFKLESKEFAKLGWTEQKRNVVDEMSNRTNKDGIRKDVHPYVQKIKTYELIEKFDALNLKNKKLDLIISLYG